MAVQAKFKAYKKEIDQIIAFKSFGKKIAGVNYEKY